MEIFYSGLKITYIIDNWKFFLSNSLEITGFRTRTSILFDLCKWCCSKYVGYFLMYTQEDMNVNNIECMPNFDLTKSY